MSRSLDFFAKAVSESQFFGLFVCSFSSLGLINDGLMVISPDNLIRKHFWTISFRSNYGQF